MLGVINGTAPNPVRLAEMCDHLGNVMGRPSWLPVPDFALKAILGEGASVVRLPFFLKIFCVIHISLLSVLPSNHNLSHKFAGFGRAKGGAC